MAKGARKKGESISKAIFLVLSKEYYWKWTHLFELKKVSWTIFYQADKPVWIPALSCRLFSGKCRILNDLMQCSKSNDMVAISPACLLPFFWGRPETTMYASPIVSTYNKAIIFKAFYLQIIKKQPNCRERRQNRSSNSRRYIFNWFIELFLCYSISIP